MIVAENFVVSAIVSVLFFVVVLLFIYRGRLHFAPGNEVEMQISELNRELRQERGYREELEQRVDFLIAELQRAGIRIRDLECQIQELLYPPSDPVVGAPRPSKPLLLICGDDVDLCNSDRQALRRANVPFQRLTHATKQSIIDELRRRRQNGNLYPWLHITAHAGAAGVVLSDGVAEPAWWHEHLDYIEVAFLAACQTSTVADALAGLVTVIFVYEDINNRDAADFSYAFWRRMLESNDPPAAYHAAIVEVPAVAEFTDIRSH